MKNLVLIYLVFASAAFSLNAQIVVIQPQSVVSQTIQPNTTAGYSNTRMYDQSGLSISYVSGVTDYTTYVSSGPEHASLDNSRSWLSAFGTTTGNFVFDLGSEYNVTNFLLWNVTNNLTSHVSNLSIELDDNPNFTSPAIALAATSSTSSDSTDPVSAQSFTLTNPQDARYVRFTILANGGALVTGFHEVAFGGTAIPEPSTYAAIAGVCALGFSMFRRRLRA